jgi:hypothetical protein
VCEVVENKNQCCGSDSSDPVTDPDPAFKVNPDIQIRIQRFNDPKIEEKNTAE